MLLEYGTILFDKTLATANSNNDWTMQLKDPFFIRPNSYVGLKEVIYTNAFNSISSSNNKFDIIEYDTNGLNPLSSTITITVGNYTSSQLITELETRLNAATRYANVYAVTFSSTTSYFTIENTTNEDVDFDFDVSNSAYLVLGFAQTTYTANAASSYLVTSVNISRLDGSIDNLLVLSPTLQTEGFIDSVSKTDSNNVLGSVQRIGNAYDQVFYSFENESKLKVAEDKFQNLNIKVVNKDFTDVSFSSGTTFVIKLVFYQNSI